MEFYIDDWKYSFEEIDGEKQLSIDNGRSAPSSLFKYYSISPHSVSALENNQFYVSQPDDFNDLFDSSDQRLDFSKITFRDVLAIFQGTDQSKLEEWWNEALKNEIVFYDLVQLCRNTLYQVMVSKFGILCLTPNGEHELMWAYYNNNHGFCIEFDHSKFPDNFRGPFPIKYHESLQPIDFNHYGGHVSFYMLTLSKKAIWRHEEEYRYLVLPSSRPFKVSGRFDNSHYELPFVDRLEKYPKEAIVSVTFGFNFLKDSEFNQVGENEYQVEFNPSSAQGSLKIRLFKYAADNFTQCYSIVQQMPSHEFKKEGWSITQNSSNKFRIQASWVA